MSNNINLIGDKNQKIRSPLLKRLNVLRFFAMLFLFAVSITSTIFFLLIAFSPLPALQQQEQRQLQVLSQFQTVMGRIELINNRVENIDQLLQSRRSLDQLLTLLLSKIPSNVSLEAYQLMPPIVSLTVRSDSLSSIQELSNQIVAEEGKSFSQVTLSSLAIDPESQEFSMTITASLINTQGEK